MKTRRTPWLSGLIVAVIGSVWMIGQVLGGLVSLVGDLLSADMSAGTTVSAPQPQSVLNTPDWRPTLT